MESLMGSSSKVPVATGSDVQKEQCQSVGLSKPSEMENIMGSSVATYSEIQNLQ
jgi:hypothetical protein